MRACPPRTLPVVAVLLVVVGGVAASGCARRSKRGDRASTSSAAATLSSAPTSTASSAAAATAAGATASAPAAASAAAIAARAAAVARAKELVADVRWMIDEGVTVNRAKAGEGDVATKCDGIESMRSSMGRDPDPELVKVLDEGTGLCAFDVPLLTASESLDHLRGTPSQASRLLVCNVAAREIAKARAVRANDPRVRSVEARRGSLCH